MSTLTIVIGLAILATFGALTTGIISMARGGEFDMQHSTQIMFSRVGFQAIAFILLLISVYFTQ